MWVLDQHAWLSERARPGLAWRLLARVWAGHGLGVAVVDEAVRGSRGSGLACLVLRLVLSLVLTACGRVLVLGCAGRAAAVRVLAAGLGRAVRRVQAVHGEQRVVPAGTPGAQPPAHVWLSFHVGRSHLGLSAQLLTARLSFERSSPLRALMYIVGVATKDTLWTRCTCRPGPTRALHVPAWAGACVRACVCAGARLAEPALPDHLPVRTKDTVPRMLHHPE